MLDMNPELRSKRLVLEPLVPSHAAALYPFLQDDRLYRYIPEDPPISAGALRDRYERLAGRQSPDGSQTWLNWTMRPIEAGPYIGTLQATVHPAGRADIAYLVFGPFQGRGYATEGLRRMVQYLRTTLDVPLIAAQIDTRNAASVAVVERVGFARVSEIRDADFFKGSSSHEYWYELTAG